MGRIISLIIIIDITFVFKSSILGKFSIYENHTRQLFLLSTKYDLINLQFFVCLLSAEVMPFLKYYLEW